MGGTAGLSEAEIKTVKHRQEYEKHLKAKEERLDRHSVSGKSGSPKKGGRGGKGVWGSVEDDIAMELKA
eukprot:CAMPEP_0117677160 /NCGR_PEP_ID=MMETSP0804-20121206/16595_1 /TAXON_ID=1074897 /ORGANISM="Tetraselmis astigmatica, Strain CCMP880" /LENGTH=68 /DNA_ID=CAMNT_0005486421 /DNA_START=337 /DNA_END=543 /DNA_ORIENTATION=+